MGSNRLLRGYIVYYAKWVVSDGRFSFASADNGGVTISPEEHAALLAGESAGFRIAPDAEGRPILIDPPAATAEQIWPQIKAERDRRKALGVLAAGNWYHSDADSRIQQLGLVLMGSTMPAGIQWKTMAGSFVEMTPTLASQIFAATAALDQAIFAAAEDHRAAMEAAASPADYDFSGGWPASYEE